MDSGKIESDTGKYLKHRKNLQNTGGRGGRTGNQETSRCIR